MEPNRHVRHETLPVIIDSPACDCSECRSYCKRPCWPIPSEIKALEASSKGAQLMLDWWEGDFHDGMHDRVYIVCPATPGYEGEMAPDVDLSPFSFLFSSVPLEAGCTFHVDGLCQLHNRGLKPAEGRAAYHGFKQPRLHEDVARHWDTDEGRAVVAKWCELRGLDNPYEGD